MPKRILVLSASVGAGHLRAAQAVELALREIDPDAEVQNLDVLGLTGAAFRKIYAEAYLDLVNLAPHMLGYLYDLMDRPLGAASKRDRLRRALERLNLAKLTDVLQERPWDVIVNTHFLPAQIIAGLRRRRRVSTLQNTVTTDFSATHRLWMNEAVRPLHDGDSGGAVYLASFASIRRRLPRPGFRSILSQPREGPRRVPAQARAEGDRPIWQLGWIRRGSDRQTLRLGTPDRAAARGGRGRRKERQGAAAARDRRGASPPSIQGDGFYRRHRRADVRGRRRRLETGRSDGVGNVTRGAALAIVNPIPGQESRNSDYLLSSAAVKIGNIATMPLKLGGLLDDSGRLETLKETARRIGKPRAAFDIARLALAFE